MSRWVNWLNHTLIAGLVIATGGIGFWLGRDSRAIAPAGSETASSQPSEVDAAAPVAAVNTQTLVVGTVTRVAEAYGTIQAAPGSSVSLSAPFDAIVQRVLVTPGAAVVADTPVIEIGPTAELKLQFKQAQDAVSAADKVLQQIRQRLTEQLATNADVTTAEQAQQTAATQLASLKQRGIGETRVLPAGVAGLVGQVSAQPGQVVTAGTPLATVESNRTFEALVGLEPVDAVLVKVGSHVTLKDVHAAADAPEVTGTVRLVAAQINPQTRLRDASVTLPPDADLPPGAYVIAQVDTTSADGLVAPRSSVMPDDDAQVLFTVTDGKARRHVVEVQFRGRDTVLVKSDDLHEGDTIVTGGNLELEDSMAVRFEPSDADAATRPATAPAAEGK